MQRSKLLKIGARGLCLFIGLVLIFPLTSASAQESKTEFPPAIEQGPTPKTPETLLKEAIKIRDQRPEEAILMLLEAMALKPEFLPARRLLADIYERQNRWDMVINEYEAITKAEGTPESMVQLITAMEKAGFLLTAAGAARTAYAKYPDKPLLLLKAGELFFKAGDDSNALNSLQEFIKHDPRQGKPFLLMGNIHERSGRLSEAMVAYLKASELMRDSTEMTEDLQRLRLKFTEVEKLKIFLPEGWKAETSGLRNILLNQRIMVTSTTAGNPQVLAMQRAKELMPGNLFNDEMLKTYESIKKMKEEMIKSGLDAKDLPNIPLPIISQKQITGHPPVYMVSLTIGEMPQAGLESVCVAAVTHAGKTYLFAWQGNVSPAQGEEVLAAVLKQVVWPQ